MLFDQQMLFAQWSSTFKSPSLWDKNSDRFGVKPIGDSSFGGKSSRTGRGAPKTDHAGHKGFEGETSSYMRYRGQKR